MASSEDSSCADRKPVFNFLIKVPNNIFDRDSIMGEPEIPVELELDEKRKAREAIHFQLYDRRISNDIHALNYAHVKAKYQSASEFVQSKITEVESLQSVIDKAEDVLSTDESLISCEIDKYIIHKEEPGKLERKMALDQLRIILSDNAGQASECANSEHGIRQITELKAKAEESLKIARKELDVLKESALKARTAVFEVERKHDDDMKQIQHLEDMSTAAGDVCRALEDKLKIIREKIWQRISVLFNYMEDAAYYRNDPENLSGFCREYVEKFMKLWNEDEEFRRQYVRVMEKDREMVSDEVDVAAASEMDEIDQETITENTNWKTKKEKDEIMVSDEVDVAAASEMDEINQETSVEDTNLETKKVGAKAMNKKARGKKKRRRADGLISNDRSSKEPQKSWLQSITKSAPPSLGNISKKKLQQVIMWAGITCVFVYVLVFQKLYY